MWKMGLKLIIGCLCGYLYIHLSLIDSPSSVIEGFILFILHPLRFFLAVFMFLIGLVMNAHLIKWLLYKTFELWRKKKYWNFGLIIFYVGFIISTAYQSIWIWSTPFSFLVLALFMVLFPWMPRK
jgi:hypothetical protein